MSLPLSPRPDSTPPPLLGVLPPLAPAREPLLRVFTLTRALQRSTERRAGTSLARGAGPTRRDRSNPVSQLTAAAAPPRHGVCGPFLRIHQQPPSPLCGPPAYLRPTTPPALTAVPAPSRPFRPTFTLDKLASHRTCLPPFVKHLLAGEFRPIDALASLVLLDPSIRPHSRPRPPPRRVGPKLRVDGASLGAVSVVQFKLLVCQSKTAVEVLRSFGA
ncbi:hypothetical protein DMC30DRAFT_182540 [Rhodotorula diobovata]|uniref:Uncharacterized protein n=1 Tax=Rhodotorula diobovata TaxID=5288 RepID=A0A5C5FYP4_9BASI|nr:hypothetical protein DMC30DRAFT_182540 [Rhodotorula diobovata]